MLKIEPSLLNDFSISPEDWEQTPEGVKTLVRALVLRLEQLEAENKSLSERLSRLEEQGVQISENSSQLPSQDRYKKKKEKREKGNRARGGQVGHKGKGRDLYPVEQCDEVYDHRPSQCRCCGENLSGEDGSPLRFFEVALARTQQVAQSILGLESTGVLVTDRYSSYNWMNPHQRQLCWAHLKRDFTAIAQRCGVSATIGEQLLALEQEAFNLWHQFRDQTLSRSELKRLIQPLRVQVKACLEAGAGFEVGYREKTPLAKTVRTCRQLLKSEVSLWTFVDQENVEPTNNAAERELRPAVIARKLSFGSRSRHGSLFVARLLTVTTSLKAQHSFVTP